MVGGRVYNVNYYYRELKPDRLLNPVIKLVLPLYIKEICPDTYHTRM